MASAERSGSRRRNVDHVGAAGALTDGGVDLLNILLGSAFGGSATDASALFGLWYVAGAGNEHTPGTVARMMDATDSFTRSITLMPMVLPNSASDMATD
ncbi:hypothetical protein [Nocardia sp. CA-120079]|uniref:hypothetical protein n=1 Tax=Nocardia sp. CA-120079 TaxID=3239974 RepID=UPI003D983E5C